MAWAVVNDGPGEPIQLKLLLAGRLIAAALSVLSG
jgi:hypothetical protein